MTLFLDRDHIRRLLCMEDLIPAMEQALKDFSAGCVQQPLRTVLAAEPPGGYCYVMPALADAIGVKIVTLYPGNAEKGLPTHMATIFLMDRETGAPLAVMDGGLITEMRTAAVSAAATRLLAAGDAKVLAILAAARRPAAIMKRCAWCGISKTCGCGAELRPMPRHSPPT